MRKSGENPAQYPLLYWRSGIPYCILRNKILWEGGIFASIPKSEYSLSNESVDYGIMIKERKKHVKKEKILLKASIVFAAVFAIVPAANAMHIMEGYLPAKYCVAWGVVCLPFLIAGFISLKNKVKENRRNLTLIAMSGAFIFVISSLKIPSVTGSCSHMTGTGLGAILFGPASVSVLGVIVLLFSGIAFSSRRFDKHLEQIHFPWRSQDRSSLLEFINYVRK